jgi:hypothetical protein
MRTVALTIVNVWVNSSKFYASLLDGEGCPDELIALISAGILL